MELLSLFVVCAVLGAVVGFSAGLLGIGGGLIAVPALLYILPWAGVPPQSIPHVAIATSLAAIILTSFASARAHHQRGNIDWGLFLPMLPGTVVGALCSGFIAELIAGEDLKKGFAVFVILMSINMAYPYKPSAKQRSLPPFPVLFVASAVIAVLSALMGIGGGTLMVPFLCLCGLEMKKAVGFSSANGVLIALWGSLGYVIAGWNVQGMPTGSFGYIYLPALAGIIATSMLVAPLGAKAASTWPTAVLKKIFAALLLVVGLKLIIG
ncbi:sulfite exporter TauE/SafE family protein [Shewanella sp. C32]|uniref:Probable membrane transporter protein n=1 Tax=Shewanella electrica TaxID=515560 RepID=A0ABT2FG07_9GAMM|nr:sulfite exporter TauE/SafE family protein [Shewanella electrica]MCH1925403.1 sulfite exporter TauE/SafE family protein [Shewanella electrica]MCS4555228.1 sulfite exporter TauE/SafE family protein [Shewanella electrica]